MTTTTDFTNTSNTSSSYLADYLSPDPTSSAADPLQADPFSRPMSPVQSAGSTPPLSSTSAHFNHNSSMSMYASPVSMSSAPYGTAGGFPRRAEHSYAQNFMPHPYTMGAPPVPSAIGQRPRGPALPSASLMHQPHQQQQQQQQPAATTTTYIPDVPSSAPDAPPSGTGGASRKRPKYTRSKKGCLTCRSKKIKCDERKPLCTRCEHGHRECTWPETVLPRRPKGAVRGVGNEDNEEDDVAATGTDLDGRRGSIPSSAVSSHFPSSTTSSHFPGLGNNSPFDTAPRRDAFDSDGYANGSQFPLLPANARQFYPRGSGAASGEFYPPVTTTVNGQPIDEYEFPPRQTFGAGPSSATSSSRFNNSLYATGPPGALPPSYNADLRRASWDSNAPSIATDARRPSWDGTSLAVSSASSPTTSSLGLGLGRAGGGGGAGGAGSSGAATSAGGSTSGGSAIGPSSGPGGSGGNGGGLMLLHSPDPLSPFFRSVQERNLVGTLSSSSSPFTPPSLSSPSSSSFFSSSSHFSSDYAPSPHNNGVNNMSTTAGKYLGASSSPVLSSASSSEFGITPEGLAYRKNSYPHLYPPPRALTLDPPAPVLVAAPTVTVSGSPSPTTTLSTMEVYRPPLSSSWASAEGDEYVSWDAYS